MAWALFLVAALAGRVAAVNYESFWHDEVFTLMIIDGPFSQTLDPHGAINQIPPLHFMLLWLWKSVFGTSEFALRLFSAICGWGAIIISGQFLRRRISVPAGWFCAVAMAAHVALVTHSIFARVYALEIMAASALIPPAAAIMDPNCRRPAAAAFLFAFVGAALVCMHYFAAFFWALATIIVLAVLWAERQENAIRKAAVLLACCLLWGLVALIFLLPFAGAHFQRGGGAGTWIGLIWGEGFQIRAAARAILELLGARTAEGYSPLPPLALPLALAPWGIVSYYAIFPKQRAESRRLGILLVALSAVQILLALIAMIFINVVQTRYLITAAVAFCGVIGIAAENTRGRRPLRLVIYAQMALMILTTAGYFSGNRVIERWNIIAPEVSATLRPGDALIFFPEVQRADFDHHAPHWQISGAAAETLPITGSPDYSAGIRNKISQLLRQYRRIVIFLHHEHIFDPDGALRRILSEESARFQERELPGRNWKLLIIEPERPGGA